VLLHIDQKTTLPSNSEAAGVSALLLAAADAVSDGASLGEALGDEDDSALLDCPQPANTVSVNIIASNKDPNAFLFLFTDKFPLRFGLNAS
jgi:hypothetical protein